MLIENTLFGVRNRIKDAIERLRMFEPAEGYYFADSYGKDSTVVRDLLIRSGVKYDGHYNLTTVDPPELVRFGKQNHPEIEVSRPKESMWQLIQRKRMPPTRIVRYCCAILKEQGGKGRVVVTGVRWQESVKRSRRRMVEVCNKSGSVKQYLHPIIDWSSDDVWEYIREYKTPYCSLYDEGFSRLGCIGCPMAGADGMEREFARWPTYRQNYLRAFAKCLEHRLKDDLLTQWTSPEAMMQWWIHGAAGKGDPDQTVMFE